MNPTLRAAALAAALGGAPSTAWALATGDDVLAPTRAAGALVAPSASGPRRLAAATVAHAAISTAWTAALARTTSGRGGLAAGAAAGLGIAVVDLGLARALRSHPRFREVAALPLAPQVADHVAFGVVAGWALARPLRC